HLPDAVDDAGDTKGPELYRAMAAHMAAHIAYTHRAISGQELSPAQMFFIGLAEDARVEYNAVQIFPGLKKLWGALQRVERAGQVEHPTVEVLEQTALALLDAGHRTGDADVDALVERFHANIEASKHSEQFSWHLGLELFNIFSARRDVPSL